MTSLIAIIINKNSGLQTGDGNQATRSIKKILRRQGRSFVKIVTISEPKKIPSIVQKLIKQNYGTIVAAGGDGTIRAVAAEIVNTQCRLGVLPTGTMNNFAKTLCIPLELELAIKILFEGHTKKVDVATVNHKVFLNNSSIGIYSRLVKIREKERDKGRHKLAAYILAAFYVFRRYSRLTVRIKAKGKEIVRTTPLVFVGNNRYILKNRFELGTRVRVNEHVLSLFFTKKISRFQFIQLFLSTFWGTIYKEKNFDFYTTKELTIESQSPVLNVVTDGEVEPLLTPLNYKIVPLALTVFVPKKT